MAHAPTTPPSQRPFPWPSHRTTRRIVCVCGSSRFMDTIAVLQWELEKAGCIALGMHLLPAGYGAFPDHQAEAEGVADQMDALHLDKIRMADAVYVVNVGGYIGRSTANEIRFATALGKPIEYLEPVNLTPNGQRERAPTTQPGRPRIH